MDSHNDSAMFVKELYPKLLELFKDTCKYNRKENSNALEILTLLTPILSTSPAFTTLRVNVLQDSVEGTKKKLCSVLQKQYEKKNRHCPEVILHSDIPDVLIIPHKGPLKWQKEPKEVIVDHLCGCAVLRGADVFAQGIIGAPSNMGKGDKVSVYADIDGKCNKGLIKPYEGRKVYVGNGVVHYSREELFVGTNKPGGLAIEMTETLYEAPCLSDLLPSLVFPQNLPSTVTAHVLGPRPGELILDMCAAPGGKTTHIATLMNNKGKVIALDKTPAKVQKVQHNAEIWNLDIITSFAFDGTKALSADQHSVFDTESGPPFPSGTFDRVLLDAPCSALGQRPCLINKMTVTQLNSYPRLQKNLFSTAVKLLKPGGTLVYSTCTITLEENEHLVAWALQKFPELELQKQTPHIGGTGYKTDRLTTDQSQLLQRFNPIALESPDTDDLVNIDTIGFFIVKFKKS